MAASDDPAPAQATGAVLVGGAAGRRLAAARLRRAILAGEMAPGQRLVEEELASALNHELHRLVREYSGQQVAAGLLERLNAQLVRHQFQLSLRPGRPAVSLEQHLAIIAAIAAGQPAQAEQATRRHLHSVITALLEQETGNSATAEGGPAPATDHRTDRLANPASSAYHNMKQLHNVR